MSKGVKTMMGTSTEISYLSSLLPDLQGWNQYRTKLGPLSVGVSCLTGTVCGTTDSETKIYH